jgi:hypothetical protein
VGLNDAERSFAPPVAPVLPNAAWGAEQHRTLARAGALWAMRAVQEARSAAVFATISAGLARFPLPVPLLGAVAQIASDELVHTALCRRLATELGVAVPSDDLAATERRLVPAGTGATTPLAALLLVEGAVGETISTALFAATRRSTSEPRSRAALTFILRDEARHARTCWAAFEQLGQATALDATALEADLSRELGIVERESILPALQRVAAGEDDPPELVALGVLPPLARVDAFYSTLEGKILPRVTALGIDGAAAWSGRYGRRG